tara:strand:+ start:72 stop:1469 length:1398 start_codon:yes stop_codon:yes gene_type:complete
MSIIIPANSAVGGGFDVANSCMFNSATSDNLVKTPSSTGNRDKWTWSAWVKLSRLGIDQNLFTAYDASTFYTEIQIGDTGRLNFINKISGSEQGKIETNRVFKDLASWYHFVIVWDSGNATAGNRMRIYVNGVEETSFATDTNPSQDQDSVVNFASRPIYVGSWGQSQKHFNGYMSEVVLLDGTAASPSSFGEFDADSGIWVPIDVSGLTPGTNGAYLNFANASALGTDVFGGTTFTANNLGTQNQYTDTPSNTYTTFAGYVGVQGNASTAQVFVEGATRDGGGVGGPLSTTLFPSKGKWFIEYNVEQADAQTDAGFGFWSSATSQIYSFYASGFKGFVIKYNGVTYLNGSQSTGIGGFGNGSIISFAMDFDNDVVNIYKNGSLHLQNYSYPISDYTDLGTGVIDGASSSSVDLNYDLNSGGGNGTFNGRKTAGGNTDGNGYGNFSMSVPSGYYAINTKNIAEYG